MLFAFFIAMCMYVPWGLFLGVVYVSRWQLYLVFLNYLLVAIYVALFYFLNLSIAQKKKYLWYERSWVVFMLWCINIVYVYFMLKIYSRFTPDFSWWAEIYGEGYNLLFHYKFLVCLFFFYFSGWYAFRKVNTKGESLFLHFFHIIWFTLDSYFGYVIFTWLYGFNLGIFFLIIAWFIILRGLIYIYIFK